MIPNTPGRTGSWTIVATAGEKDEGETYSLVTNKTRLLGIQEKPWVFTTVLGDVTSYVSMYLKTYF